ncbi:MAG: hypothetical protein HQM08_13160 [Candidatus Riflebacteria bacterium]|nr:hypothetical protein [Candidatus Riflebacteria bacterium]
MRAMLAAKSVIQLAIYKFRVLPNEYYEMIHWTKPFPGSPLDDHLRELFCGGWVNDFNSSMRIPNCPAFLIMQEFSNSDSCQYSCGINAMELISKSDHGYVKDYIRIEAFGACGKEKQVIEELIEIGITKP